MLPHSTQTAVAADVYNSHKLKLDSRSSQSLQKALFFHSLFFVFSILFQMNSNVSEPLINSYRRFSKHAFSNVFSRMLVAPFLHIHTNNRRLRHVLMQQVICYVINVRTMPEIDIQLHE